VRIESFEIKNHVDLYFKNRRFAIDVSRIEIYEPVSELTAATTYDTQLNGTSTIATALSEHLQERTERIPPLVVCGICSTWRDTPAAKPAPLLRAAAAAHVVAAFAFVGGNFAARAALACVFDELQRGLFRCHVVASPLCARLVGMSIAVRETIHVVALALDAGFLGARGGAHRLAPAADADVWIFGLGLKSLVLVECFCVDRSANKITWEITVADGTEAMEVSLADL
jgi:hypothetical protein